MIRLGGFWLCNVKKIKEKIQHLSGNDEVLENADQERLTKDDAMILHKVRIL